MSNFFSDLFGNSGLAKLYQSVGTVSGHTLTSYRVPASITITVMRNGAELHFIYNSSDLHGQLPKYGESKPGLPAQGTLPLKPV